MKILCAPDSFKESLSAIEVAQAMAKGVYRASPDLQVDCCPLADGGEGTLAVLVEARGGTFHELVVPGPLPNEARPVRARIGMLDNGRVGVVELAQASGLALIPAHQRNPLHTTTYSTGLLLREAISLGVEEIIICIGGSGTIDGGAGLAQALGVRFFDEQDQLIERPITGGMLHRITRWEPEGNLPLIRVACDVDNPLCGSKGAAAVYGPQKGATPQQVRELNVGLAHLASLTGIEEDGSFFGAAGGAGFGLYAFCNARLEAGIALILEATKFSKRCAEVDLVLTGEGQLDAQSLRGKVCLGAAMIAQAHRIPCIAIVGQAGKGAEMCLHKSGEGALSQYVSLAERFGIDQALGDPSGCISHIAEELITKLIDARD